MSTARITITSQVLAYLKTVNLHNTSEIPISDVAYILGMPNQQVKEAIRNLRRRKIIPAATARKPRFAWSDWRKSSDWAWAIHPAPETKVKTQLEIAVENEKRATAVKSYIREWKARTGRVKPKPKVQRPVAIVERSVSLQLPKRQTWPRPPAPHVKGFNWKPTENRWYCEGKSTKGRFWTTLYPPEQWREALEAYKLKLIEKIESQADLAKRLNAISKAIRDFENATHQSGGGDRAGTPTHERGGSGEGVREGDRQAHGQAKACCREGDDPQRRRDEQDGTEVCPAPAISQGAGGDSGVGQGARAVEAGGSQPWA